MTRSLSRPVALSYELHVLLPCSTPPLRLARSPPAPPPGAGEGASGGCHPSRGLRMSFGAGGDLTGRRDVVSSVACELRRYMSPGTTSSDRSEKACSCSLEYVDHAPASQISARVFAPITVHSRSRPA